MKSYCKPVSQLCHHRHFGLGNSVLWEVVLCVVRDLTASPASTHFVPLAPQTHTSCDNQKISPNFTYCPLGSETDLFHEPLIETNRDKETGHTQNTVRQALLLLPHFKWRNCSSVKSTNLPRAHSRLTRTWIP